MSLPSSMADFVPCDRLLQKAYYLVLVGSVMRDDDRLFLSMHRVTHVARLLAPLSCQKVQSHGKEQIA